MKDEKLVAEGVKLILKGMGEEAQQQQAHETTAQKNKPLSFKQAVSITGLICAGLVIVFSVIGSIKLQNDRMILFMQERAKAQGFSDLVMSAIRYPMMTGDQDIIQLQFEQFKELKGIMEMQLLDHVGVVKRTTDRSIMNKKLAIRSEQAEIERNINNALDGKSFVGLEPMRGGRGRTFTVLKPIVNERSCYGCHGNTVERLGVLRIVLDWTSFERALQAMQQQNRLFSGISAIIMGFLILGVLKHYSK